MIRVLLLVIGYCLGMIQTGYLYGRMKGIDIRKAGSGNSGATNSLRVLGKKAGLIVFAVDLCKCFIPCLIVYRLSAITWFLAKHLVRVEYAGLPNILLHKEVTPELLQDKVTAGNIAEVVLPWLTDEVKRQENIRELKSVRAVLGEGGAVRRTAELILRTAEGK